MDISNRFCVISKSTHNEYGLRSFVCYEGATENPMPDRFAIVPKAMIEEILATQGYCDIVLNEDETEVVSFTAREIPEIEEPEVEEPISEVEQLRADIDYLAIMTGVTL